MVIVAGLLAMVLWSRTQLYGVAVPSVSTPVDAPNVVALADREPASLAPYEGLGAWIDVFDYSPAFSPDGVPALDPADTVQAMQAAGVRTIYVQAARVGERSGGTTEDRWVLAELLLAAHAADLDVVAWFLPVLDADMHEQNAARVSAMAEFEVLGHRFDGIAVDIEAEPEPSGEVLERRNAALLAISSVSRWVAGDRPVGAIVLPPPLIEDVNDRFWPEFPWGEIAPFYDVWLPMAYWSGRSDASGFGDGYGYSAESAQRIRERIADPSAPVHAIGGIGGVAGERDFTAAEVLASIDDYPLFAQSVVDAAAIGGSIYDWNTQDAAARALMAELFGPDGPAGDLTPAPIWRPDADS